MLKGAGTIIFKKSKTKTHTNRKVSRQNRPLTMENLILLCLITEILMFNAFDLIYKFFVCFKDLCLNKDFNKVQNKFS